MKWFYASSVPFQLTGTLGFRFSLQTAKLRETKEL